MDAIVTGLDQLARSLLAMAERLYRGIERLSDAIHALPLTAFQWLTALFVVFFLIYALATPIFEASDELWHFGMVEYIADNHALPVQDPDAPPTTYRQEGSQPPLYYTLAAAIISPLDISNIDDYRQPNPHVRAGIPGSHYNKNLVLHFPPVYPSLSGTALAVLIVRLFNIVLGVVTIWAVYHSARLLAPRRPAVALLAAGLTAFNPMFIFIMASVNNDNLVIALNSVVIYYALRTLHEGFDTRRSLAIAALIALATLSKLSGLVLVPTVALAGLWVARRDRDLRGLVVLGLAMMIAWGTLAGADHLMSAIGNITVALVAAVIAGWWYVRNLMLYGELFGTKTMVAVAGPRLEPFTWLTLLEEFQGFRIAYWGLFGAVNIQTAEPFYALTDLLTLVGGTGLLFALAQLFAIRDFAFARYQLEKLALLGGILTIGFVAYVNWTAQTLASQGRLMFPFIAAIAPLLALGLVEVIWWAIFLTTPATRSRVQGSSPVSQAALGAVTGWLAGALGVMAMLIPFVTIMPQYAPPQAIDAPPAQAAPVYARYDDVELIAYETIDRRYAAGERVPLTLYWRVLERSDSDRSISITLIDPAGEEIGKVDSYPGAGRLQTSQWPAGAIYADTYEVDLNPPADARYPFGIQVGWWHVDTGRFVPATDGEGQQLEAVVLDGGAVVGPDVVTHERGLLDWFSSGTDFGAAIRLADFELSTEPLAIDLDWQALGPPDGSYTAFVHIVDEGGALAAQSDVPPALPTRYWRAGDQISTVHRFDGQALPAGRYQVLIGWYRYEQTSQQFTRLSVAERPDNAYPLLTLVVDEDGVIVAE